MTSSSVLAALASVDEVGSVGYILETPHHAPMEVHPPGSTAHRTALVEYYLQTSPLATWDRLAGRCLYCKQDSAVQAIMRDRPKPEEDSTLNLTSLSQLLCDVDWYEDYPYGSSRIRALLDIPVSVYDALHHQNASKTECITTYCKWYLSNRPTPSWRHVAETLYHSGEHDVLELLKDQVPSLKGTAESHALLSKAMKLGHLDSFIGKMLVYGACGTGKSSFLDLMVGEEPKEVRVSTPLAARPTTMYHVDVHSKKWSKLSDKQRKEFLIQALMAKQEEESGAEEEDVSGEEDHSGEENLSSEDDNLSSEDDNLSSEDDNLSSEDDTPSRMEHTEQHHVPMNSEVQSTTSMQDHSPATLTSMTAKDEEKPTLESSGEHTEQRDVPMNSEAQNMASTEDSQPEPTSSKSGEEEKPILKSISSFDELVEIVRECSLTGEAITCYRKIILIDSGGQPQFHEILPVFMRRMSLYVFVFKLSEELDHKPEVVYYGASGKPIGNPYESSHTHLQLLQHCLRTLNTHRVSYKEEEEVSEQEPELSKEENASHRVSYKEEEEVSEQEPEPSKEENASSKIMIVGTHRDKEGLFAGRRRERKERKLAELLLPAFKDQVLYYDLPRRKFIFPLNAKKPKSCDRALIEMIQHLVTTECSLKPEKVPLQYFALELVLEEASGKLGRGILSIEECQEAAAKLHFDKHTLDVALQYLDKLSVVMYFPEVLEGVLFVNPQVLLDKATEMVENMYRLMEGMEATKNVTEWQTFIDYARFDLKFLSRPNFSKHYIDGLFTPVELVKLFKKLLIFADFSSKELFMPALLRILKEEEVSEYCVASHSHAAPLALDFPLGGPLLGVFCALCCFLVSNNNRFPGLWEVEVDSLYDTPTCLYRNCIRFSLPEFPGSVTLIDTFSHFQVHVDVDHDKVDSDELERDWYHKMCPVVRQAIVSGLKMVTITLGYSDCLPSLAMVCPCKIGTAHIATIKDGSWICKRNKKKYGRVDDSYLIWTDDASQQKAISAKGSS